MTAILLIEDDAGIRAALTRALTEGGHTVTWRPAGLPGLQAVIDDRPDVVLLDRADHLDARTRTATLDGRTLELSRKEFDLLLALASRAGEVVTKRDLLAEVWRQPYGGGDRTVGVRLVDPAGRNAP